MKIQNKEVVTTIIVPIIAIACSATNSDNWPYVTIFVLTLINITLWLWIKNKDYALFAIIPLSIFFSIGGYYYYKFADNELSSKLEVEPIQVMKNIPTTPTAVNDSIIKSIRKKDSINDTYNARIDALNYDSIQSIIKKQQSIKFLNLTQVKVVKPNTKKWNIDKKWYVTERVASSTPEVDSIQCGYGGDDYLLAKKYQKVILIYNISYDDERVIKGYKGPDYFPLIKCIVRNNGIKSATIYGLSSKIICEEIGHTAQGSYLLKPLNKEFRLYPGEDLLFENPILIENNATGVIQFSPTFKRSEVRTFASAPHVLFSVSLIYFDGNRKSELLLGYYYVSKAI